MKRIILEDVGRLSRLAAEEVKAVVSENPKCVLGFATGSTPLGLYRELIRMNKASEIDFSQVTTFNLDEYVGLDCNHPLSYVTFMETNLFNHINIKKDSYHLPNGCAPDLKKECAMYEDMIREAGGVDLQILGIGHNGHIGFNEPGTPFDSITHVVELDNRTREANSRFFSSIDEVPERAITMGISTIMKAKKIILIILGEDKAEIAKKALTGSITPEVPASVLQQHPNVNVYLDDKAASKL